MQSSACEQGVVDGYFLISLMVERLIICGRKVENAEYQESRGAPDGRGIVEVDRGEHDNSRYNRLRERLARVRQEQGLSLADRLLAIGRDCAARLKEPFRSADHGDFLYDERGLPR